MPPPPPTERNRIRHYGGFGSSHPDRLLAGLAMKQHGVVSRTQAVEAGIGEDGIDHRLRTGRLHQVHRAVFAVGHRRLSREGRWMAAVLAAGPHAVLSHRSTAAHFGLVRLSGLPPEVTAHGRHRHPGLRTYRKRLPADEVTEHEGIPVTSVARTLLDLAATHPRLFEPAARQAEVLRLHDPLSLAELVKRYPGRPGVAIVRLALQERRIDASITRSELEDRFLAFLDAYELPRPLTNQTVGAHGRRFEVDCLWPRRRVVAELDGRAFHDNPISFEEDRERDLALTASGYTVVRVTWRRLHDSSTSLAASLRAILSARPR